MKRHHLFYSPIIETELDLDYTDLVNKILKESETESSRTFSNRGGWQSDNNFMFRDSLRPYLDELDRHINDICAKCYTDWIFYFENSWVNVNQRGDYNLSHKHPGAQISAVFWVLAPENCGDIVFSHPSDFSVIPERYDDLRPTWKYKPKQGSMLIFPAYLLHCVEQSKTDDKRISIAFNYS